MAEPVVEDRVAGIRDRAADPAENIVEGQVIPGDVVDRRPSVFRGFFDSPLRRRAPGGRFRGESGIPGPCVGADGGELLRAKLTVSGLSERFFELF